MDSIDPRNEQRCQPTATERLITLREGGREGRAEETDEHLEGRLAARRQRDRARRAAETPEQREARLPRLREQCCFNFVINNQGFQGFRNVC